MTIVEPVGLSFGPNDHAERRAKHRVYVQVSRPAVSMTLSPCFLADPQHFTGYVSTKRSAEYTFVSSKHPTIRGSGSSMALMLRPLCSSRWTCSKPGHARCPDEIGRASCRERVF